MEKKHFVLLGTVYEDGSLYSNFYLVEDEPYKKVGDLIHDDNVGLRNLGHCDIHHPETKIGDVKFNFSHLGEGKIPEDKRNMFSKRIGRFLHLLRWLLSRE